jgi:hypothetical protein
MIEEQWEQLRWEIIALDLFNSYMDQNFLFRHTPVLSLGYVWTKILENIVSYQFILRTSFNSSYLFISSFRSKSISASPNKMVLK